MEPTVQVAAFGIIATIISTLGVVMVAYLNKQSPTAIKPNYEDKPDDVSDAEWVQLLLRKETAISNREKTIAELQAHRDYCLRNHHDTQ